MASIYHKRENKPSIRWHISHPREDLGPISPFEAPCLGENDQSKAKGISYGFWIVKISQVVSQDVFWTNLVPLGLLSWAQGAPGAHNLHNFELTATSSWGQSVKSLTDCGGCDRNFQSVIFKLIIQNSRCRDQFVDAPSQWEMMLQCNMVSHWLGTSTKWSLCWALSVKFFSNEWHNLTDKKSTLVQVMAWCRQATSHYLT